MPDKRDGHEIKDLRKCTKMTQKQLADKLGVAEKTIRRWEKGESRPSQLAQRELQWLHRKIGGGF